MFPDRWYIVRNLALEMTVLGDGSPAQYWIGGFGYDHKGEVVDDGSTNSVSLCEVPTDSTGDNLVLLRSKNVSVGHSGS